MSLQAQIIEVIADTLDIDAADIKVEESLYSGVGIDSTEMVEVAVALGKKFGIAIKSGELNNKQSVKEIVAFIEKKK